MLVREISLQDDYFEFIREESNERMVFVLFYPPIEECIRVMMKLYEKSEKELYADIGFVNVDLSLDWV